jgi:hypothetical protein
MFSILTSDWTDEDATMEIGRSVLRSGTRSVLRYKPDIFTVVGIYRANPWKIKPTIYTLQN